MARWSTSGGEKLRVTSRPCGPREHEVHDAESRVAAASGGVGCGQKGCTARGTPNPTGGTGGPGPQAETLCRAPETSRDPHPPSALGQPPACGSLTRDDGLCLPWPKKEKSPRIDMKEEKFAERVKCKSPDQDENLRRWRFVHVEVVWGGRCDQTLLAESASPTSYCELWKCLMHRI